MKYAFVCWIGDPKPKCWQVILTSVIQLKEGQTREDLKEGDVYDAVWNVDEESSPATVIKLGDDKTYLKTYMQHEYLGQWEKDHKKPTDLKRKRVPKQTLQEYVLEENDSDQELKVNKQQLSKDCIEDGTHSDTDDEPKLKKTKTSVSRRREKVTKVNKKIKRRKSWQQLRKRTANLQKYPVCSTVAEARALQKQKEHPQFGGKVPKDLHADCKSTIQKLKDEIEQLKAKLEEKAITNNELPEDIPKFGKIPRHVGITLYWKEISPGIWMDSMTLNACMRGSSSKTHFARTLLDKFFPDIKGKRLNEVDNDIVEAIIDLSLMSKFQNAAGTAEETRGTIKQSLRKKCNQYIFQEKRPDYFKVKSLNKELSPFALSRKKFSELDSNSKLRKRNEVKTWFIQQFTKLPPRWKVAELKMNVDGEVVDLITSKDPFEKKLEDLSRVRLELKAKDDGQVSDMHIMN
ncbi:hypothetical protein AC249_AIPGENE20398 [Exaiptasia diaphana]|nr:hypothetical protein AC249_AIPGENE20398 [Exaiptasia diaphana]